MSLTLVVKPQGVVGAADFSIVVDPESTVADLKIKIADKLGWNGVRVVSRGKILNDDATTLISNGLKDGSSLFAVRDKETKVRDEAANQKVKYEQSLEELKSMGFEDETQCLKALIKNNGDLNAAIFELAEGANEAETPATGESDPFAVVANVYDISGGMAQSSSMMMIGKYMELLPHTGIVVFGQEYFFSQEPGVSEPGKSLQSPVKKTFQLGCTKKTKEELIAFLEQLKAEYTPSTYDFITKNSNHYADAIAKFLLDGTGIPSELLSLSADLGATPQGRQMATLLSNMQATTGSSFFSPTGTFFHGGTPANPAFAQMFSQLGANQPSMAQGGYPTNLAAPIAPVTDPRIRFKAELEELESMGFPDADACIRALTQTNGDISAAVDILAGQ